LAANGTGLTKPEINALSPPLRIMSKWKKFMTVDWIATLQYQANIVMEVSQNVAYALDASDLTIEQASRLYRMVELGAQDFDQIAKVMNEHDLDASFIDAVETIEDTWTNLSVATANRLRVMRGLDPIDIAPDDRNDV
jgi:hypothetical protein